MVHSVMTRAAVFAAAALLFPMAAPAAELRVPSGFKTISAALEKAAPGDTVMVAPGEYRERLTVPAGAGLTCEIPEKCALDGGGTGAVVTLRDGASLDGFTVRNSGKAGFSGTKMEGGARIENGAATVTNNRITGNNAGVILIQSGRSLIARNRIEGNSRYGIYLLYSKPEIRNNTITGNKDKGIYSGYSEPLAANNVISGSDTLVFSEVSVVTLTGNILTRGANAIQIAEFPKDQQGVAPVISHNLLWNNAMNYINATAGEGDIAADPMFVNEAKGDYTLKPGSPARDAGNPGKTFHDPDGSRADMGAHGGPLAGAPALAPQGGGAAPSAKAGWLTPAAPKGEEPGAGGWDTVSMKDELKMARANYLLHCSSCHGEKGDGEGQAAEALSAPPRDHTDTSYMSTRTDDELFTVISEGGTALDFDESMPPHKTVMTEAEARGLVKYLRKLCACQFTGK
ncbi:MAG: right-handed parallel beta-helix repeat-containing protein [Nitrospinae bacterium]|nr:right-handed parallel beta-helix repeat-containing protein [Nitrospinota bacterium]